MERGHFLRRRRLGRIRTPGPERELLGIAEDVRVAVTSVRRHIESHARARLGRRGEARPATYQNACCKRSYEALSSCQHTSRLPILSDFPRKIITNAWYMLFEREFRIREELWQPKVSHYILD